VKLTTVCLIVRWLSQRSPGRSRHLAYEGADLIRQAASLYYGLIKNHPWVGGNKRTATAITNEFLKTNGKIIEAPTSEIVELVLAIEENRWHLDEIEIWLRPRVFNIPDILKVGTL